MLFTCDIGNTRIKYGLFDGDELSNSGTINSLFDLFIFIDENKIKNIAVSSVVPEKMKIFNELMKKHPELKYLQITRNLKLNLKINYETPGTLGIDRICSAEGAFFLFNKSGDSKNYNEKDFIISVDFGTATTINVIKYPGEFIGGMIFPGIEMMFSSLLEKTSQLPLVSENEFNEFIGKSTKGSIATGILNASAGALNRTVKYIGENYNAENIFIYVTGGNADKVKDLLDEKFLLVNGLVLYGIKSIYEKNK